MCWYVFLTLSKRISSFVSTNIAAHGFIMASFDDVSTSPVSSAVITPSHFRFHIGALKYGPN